MNTEVVHRYSAAYRLRSSPTCKVSTGLTRPRAHAARKMDIDGFATRSVSLITIGERYSATPRSSRTATVPVMNMQSHHVRRQHTYPRISIGDETRPHAHSTKCTDCCISARLHSQDRVDSRVSRVSSKRRYPSRELNRFMRVDTIEPRCFSTAPVSAPAPVAVREMTSLHQLSAPAR
jgi:hypothetical protein